MLLGGSGSQATQKGLVPLREHSAVVGRPTLECVDGWGGNLKPSPSLVCDLGSIDAISMLTSAQESPNGSSPTGRTKRRREESEVATEKAKDLLSHLPKTKESAPRNLPSAPPQVRPQMERRLLRSFLGGILV